MNKAELIEMMADNAGITKSQANMALDAMTDSIGAALKKGDRVTLVGFGTFSVSDRAARNGRNPQTGETIKIKATKVPKFKAGKEFSTLVKGGKSAGGAKSGGSKSAAPAKGAASKGAAGKGAAASKAVASKATAKKK